MTAGIGGYLASSPDYFQDVGSALGEVAAMIAAEDSGQTLNLDDYSRVYEAILTLREAQLLRRKWTAERRRDLTFTGVSEEFVDELETRVGKSYTNFKQAKGENPDDFGFFPNSFYGSKQKVVVDPPILRGDVSKDVTDLPRLTIKRDAPARPSQLQDEKIEFDRSLRRGAGAPSPVFGRSRPDPSPAPDLPEKLDGASLENPMREAAGSKVSPIQQAALSAMGFGRMDLASRPTPAKLQSVGSRGGVKSDVAKSAAPKFEPVSRASLTSPSRRAAEQAVGVDNLTKAVDRVGRRNGVKARGALEELLDGPDEAKARNAAMGAYADLLNDDAKRGGTSGDDAEAEQAASELAPSLSTTQEVSAAIGKKKRNGRAFYRESELYRAAVQDSIGRGLNRRRDRESRFSFRG